MVNKKKAQSFLIGQFLVKKRKESSKRKRQSLISFMSLCFQNTIFKQKH